jgi:hypothetical protein
VFGEPEIYDKMIIRMRHDRATSRAEKMRVSLTLFVERLNLFLFLNDFFFASPLPDFFFLNDFLLLVGDKEDYSHVCLIYSIYIYFIFNTLHAGLIKYSRS